MNALPAFFIFKRGNLMTESARDALIAQADAAASRREFKAALGLIERAAAIGPADLGLNLKLASLYRATGQLGAALTAVDSALGCDPLDFVALMMRGALIEQTGDTQSAGEAYGRALAQLGNGQPPPALAKAVERARALVQQHVEQVTTDLLDSFADVPLTPAERQRLSRFASNTGRSTRHYHSEPTDFHVPGLAEVEFPDRRLFPFLGQLESATSVIRDEFEALIQSDRGELVPYVRYDDTVPMRQWKELNHSRNWTAIHLLERGERIESNASRCPQTMEALAALPQPRIPGHAPNAMFSLLAPCTRIPPHHGVANFRLVCHLPLIVPEQCSFRVGSERRSWVEGEAFVFDDTIEHEAENMSSRLRVVLIVDLWHPDLSSAEQRAVSQLVQRRSSNGGL